MSNENVEPNNVFLAENDESPLLRETLGCGVVESGCITTVCGEIWYNSYIETLNENDRRRIISNSSEHKFRFGVGKTFQSKKEVILPMYIDDIQILMKTPYLAMVDVVCTIKKRYNTIFIVLMWGTLAA